MKRKKLMIAGLVAALALIIGVTVNAAGQAKLDKVRKATARFHQVEVAQAAGYTLVPGLDHCFNEPGVGAMGYHYIKTSSLDLKLHMLQPEAMVYFTGPDGKLKLGAVEYIVPAAEWDAQGLEELPAILGHRLHLNKNLGVYVLHAWIWRHNPAGIFEDWNPAVSCP
jgi:hypothetical protein